MRNRLFTLPILLATFLLGCPKEPSDQRPATSGTTAETSASQGTIRIAEFNCLHLGWNNGKDLDAVARTMAAYHVVGLIEVMDTMALPGIETRLQTLSGAEWTHVASDNKLGRSTYKEFYAFIYRKDKAVYLPNSENIWNDAGDKFEREPYHASFKSGNFDYTLIILHSDFDSNKDVMRKEAKRLAVVFQNLQGADSNENDLIVMGDF